MTLVSGALVASQLLLWRKIRLSILLITTDRIINIAKLRKFSSEPTHFSILFIYCLFVWSVYCRPLPPQMSMQCRSQVYLHTSWRSRVLELQNKPRGKCFSYDDEIKRQVSHSYIVLVSLSHHHKKQPKRFYESGIHIFIQREITTIEKAENRVEDSILKPQSFVFASAWFVCFYYKICCN